MAGVRVGAATTFACALSFIPAAAAGAALPSLGTVDVVPLGEFGDQAVTYDSISGKETLKVAVASTATSVTIDAGSGRILSNDSACTVSGGKATCRLPRIEQVNVNTRGDADTVQVTGTGPCCQGTGGFVVVDGGEGPDALHGGGGDEWLRGGPGNDVLRGNAGSDFLEPGLGSDDIGGGTGAGDQVMYVEHPTSVRVSLDGVRNDGASGELDNARTDIEAINGTRVGPDTLVGNAAANVIWLSGEQPGSARGLGGNDTLLGIGTLDGGDGDDSLWDYSVAGDVVLAGAGDDRVESSFTRPDTIDCGDGLADVADVDVADTVTGCETVNAS